MGKKSKAVSSLISKSRPRLRLLFSRAADTFFFFLPVPPHCALSPTAHSPETISTSHQFYIFLIKPNLLMTSSYSKGSHACYLGRLWLRHKAPSTPRICAHLSVVHRLETQPSKAPLPAPPLTGGCQQESHPPQDTGALHRDPRHRSDHQTARQ